MDDKDFAEEYRREFDKIHASEQLRTAVKNVKPRRIGRQVTPLKAAIGTVAAAFLIFAAVHDYSFENDTSGVISETVASTQIPEARFEETAERDEISDESVLPVQNEESGEKKTVNVPRNEVNKSESKQRGNIERTQTVTSDEYTVSEPAHVTDSTETHEPSVLSADGVSRMTGAQEYVPVPVRWTLEEYYEYLGADVSEKTGVEYIGQTEFEFEMGSDGLPVDDTVVLKFSVYGGKIGITVSKYVLFDEGLNGTMTENDSGFNAYKISGGIYFIIHSDGIEKEAFSDLINRL